MWQRVAAQFRQPRGIAGRLAGRIMAHRPSNHRRNAWTLDLLAIEPHHRLLELGFGPGEAIADAASRLVAGTVTGIDHSAVMCVQSARRNRNAIARGRVRLIEGNCDDLATLEGPFDRIYSANVLQFIEDRAALFTKLHRLLAPQGIVATTYQPRHPGATDDDAERFGNALLEDMACAGFAAGRLERLTGEGRLTICALAIRPRDGAERLPFQATAGA